MTALSYAQTKKYLDSFINYEKRIPKNINKFKLSKVRKFFDQINVPYKKLNAIHIAGTKGKGSTATMLACLLAECGFRVGLYTSPHFNDLRERIRIIDGKTKANSYLISKKELATGTSYIKSFFDKKKNIKEKVTFFEVYTAICFIYFLKRKVDFSIIETGLGGRLDATNVINPLISIITHIGYDHTDILGKTLAKIAYEKSGIIKYKKPVIISKQNKQAYSVIKNICLNKKAYPYSLGKDFDYRNIDFKKKVSSFDFYFKDKKLTNLSFLLKGKHQIENASLALAALCVLKDKMVKIGDKSLRSGLRKTLVSGRFEIVKNNPLIVLDVAHNVSSFLALKNSLKLYFPKKKIIIIFAACLDKDVKKMIDCISYYKLILTSFDSQRCFKPNQIESICKSKDSILAKDIKSALKIAYKYYNKDCLILIAGSFFLVAQAKKVFKNETK